VVVDRSGPVEKLNKEWLAAWSAQDVELLLAFCMSMSFTVTRTDDVRDTRGRGVLREHLKLAFQGSAVRLQPEKVVPHDDSSSGPSPRFRPDAAAFSFELEVSTRGRPYCVQWSHVVRRGRQIYKMQTFQGPLERMMSSGQQLLSFVRSKQTASHRTLADVVVRHCVKLLALGIAEVEQDSSGAGQSSRDVIPPGLSLA
jgi:hypothetical protein